MIKTEITEATTSMTSVPKPLKFLTPQYPKLVEAYKNHAAADSFKVSCIDHFDSKPHSLHRKISLIFAR